MHRLRFHPAVKRDLKPILREIVKKIHAAWEALAANPYLGYKLKGRYAGQMAYDFSYRYRIIYQVEEPTSTITILEVWHRSWDYRR